MSEPVLWGHVVWIAVAFAGAVALNYALYFILKGSIWMLERYLDGQEPEPEVRKSEPEHP